MNRRMFIRASFVPFIGSALARLSGNSSVVTTICEKPENVPIVSVLSSRNFRVPLSYAPALSESQIVAVEKARMLSSIESLFDNDDLLFKKLTE